MNESVSFCSELSWKVETSLKKFKVLDDNSKAAEPPSKIKAGDLEEFEVHSIPNW